MFALSQIYGVPISSLAERFEMDLRAELNVPDILGRDPESLNEELQKLRVQGRYPEALINYIDTVLVAEDMELCEQVQRGLRSRGYEQGKFVVDRAHCEFSEHHVHFFQRFVYQALTR